MKRIFLFLVTNLAMMFVLMITFHVVCALLGPETTAALSHDGVNYGPLLAYALVFGMGGAFLSLLFSKPIAKMSVGARTIDGTEGPAEQWLVDTVARLADSAGVKTPEVAIYEGSANAFATGAFRNHALVAVSSEIMEQMTKEELRAVLGHEMSHVANGDMVTLTLVQGVLNACVILLSRIIARVVDGALAGNRDGERRGSSGVYFLVTMILQFVLGIGASLVVFAFSRRREYAADAGSAKLLGSPAAMIAALRRLGNLQPGVLPDSLKAFGVTGRRKTSLFSTHPALEDRIAALERLQIVL